MRDKRSAIHSTPPPPPARHPSWSWPFGAIKCADIENNDEGTVQIGSDTFRGPNADVCDRS